MVMEGLKLHVRSCLVAERAYVGLDSCPMGLKVAEHWVFSGLTLPDTLCLILWKVGQYSKGGLQEELNI